MKAVLGTSRRVTLPKEYTNRMNIVEGDTLCLDFAEDSIIIKKCSATPDHNVVIMNGNVIHTSLTPDEILSLVVSVATEIIKE